MNEGIRKYDVGLVKSRYDDFGSMLTTEVLLAKHPFRLGRETLRRWRVAEGLSLVLTQ